MKPYLCLALASLALDQAAAQQVNFANRFSLSPQGGIYFAPVYGVNPAQSWLSLTGNATTNGGATDYTGCPLLLGTGFSASLWAAPQGGGPNDFIHIQTVPFRIDPTAAGMWQNTVTPPSVPSVTVDNTPVMLRVYAWDNAGGTVTTWPAVLANPNVPRGASTEFIHNVRVLPNAPGNLVNFTSFNLIAVPEPSSIALGVLGVGAGIAAWFRRRLKP